MKVKNITKHRFCHARLNDAYKLEMLVLRPEGIKDVPDEIAKSWIKAGGVIEYVEPADVKKLENENDKLRKELEELKQSKDCAECHTDEKTPAQEDCEECNKKTTKPKNEKTKSSTTKKETK